MTTAARGLLLAAVLAAAGCSADPGAYDGADRLGPVEPAPSSAPPRAPATVIGPGVHQVHTDVVPGTYRTPGAAPSGGGVCHWARLGLLGTQLDSGKGPGPAEVTLPISDAVFVTTGCQPWVRVADARMVIWGRVSVAVRAVPA